MSITSKLPKFQTVNVTILLVGGHQYTLLLKSESPLLHNLLNAIAAQSQLLVAGSAQLFEVPLNESGQTLWFSSQQLVGVVTQPQVSNETAEPIVPSGYAQIHNFLSPAETNRLLEYVAQRESDFIPSGSYNQANDYRSSKVLASFPEFYQIIRQRIIAVLPHILPRLKLPQFPVSFIEAQLTAHNDGDYYKIHRDNGRPETASRELTYVYYFHRQPKSFAGGELKIYDGKVINNRYARADSFKIIEPSHNTIVFFLSRYLHEVLPIVCPSKRFGDGRFTINGWVHRDQQSI